MPVAKHISFATSKRWFFRPTKSRKKDAPLCYTKQRHTLKKRTDNLMYIVKRISFATSKRGFSAFAAYKKPKKRGASLYSQYSETHLICGLSVAGTTRKP
jgi:hypothetical protein